MGKPHDCSLQCLFPDHTACVQAFLGSRWPAELGQRWADACLRFQAKTHRVALAILGALALALRARGICDVPLEVGP